MALETFFITYLFVSGAIMIISTGNKIKLLTNKSIKNKTHIYIKIRRE